MKKAWLAEENTIYRAPVSSNVVESGKIYIREQFGRFQRIRRKLNLVLMAIFVLLPLIRFQGKQAVLFDIAQQRIDIFGWSLFPQDLFIVALLFVLAAFSLFYVSKRYGRVWCGYACPQTVWTLMFNWIERRVEGSHHQSKSLDRQPWGPKKLLQKLFKHGLWMLVSMLTSLVFVSYFVPADRLYTDFLTANLPALEFGWVMFFAACTYINAAWLREKMCLHICPYSRFQSAMFDRSTKLVTYDVNRGESRGARKRNAPKPEGLGDCVDCNLCVQVCPAGIDIREGVQYECIHCGLCIDACNATMDKFNYARGLIQYSAQEQSASSGIFNIGYAVAIVLTALGMIVWAINRPSFEVNLSRDRQVLYRINSAGEVENTYLLKTLNKTQQSRDYRVEIAGHPGWSVAGTTEFRVQPGEYFQTALPVAYAGPQSNNKWPIEFIVRDLQTGEFLTKVSTFYAGHGDG